MLKSLPPDPKIRFDSELVALINEADKMLYLLEGAIDFLAEDHITVSNLIFVEAANSLRLDGFDAFISDSFKNLIHEKTHSQNVFEYTKAISLGQKLLRDVGSTSHIIKSVHKELMQSVKLPGEFKKIGTESVPLLMHDLENYVASDISYPIIINAALIHAQFEMIHPFSNGNGLVGRILFLLNLLWKKRLSKPVIQISKQLAKTRSVYFERLAELERNNNWEPWVKYFLRTVIEAARDTSSIIKKISALEQRDYQKILEKEIVSTPLLKLFELLFRTPMITLPYITEALGINKQTANVAIGKLLEENILVETTGQQRNRIFAYKDYIEILDS